MEKTAVESFLEGTEDNLTFEPPKESSDPFAQPEKEVPKEEGKVEPLPFHKDPKIQKYLDKREKQIEDRLKSDFESKLGQKETATEDEFKDVIDSFTTVIGNDTPEKVQALNALQKSLHSLDAKAVRRAEERIEEIRNQELEADKEAENELNEAFEDIEETFDVDLTSKKAQALRSEFVSFVEKIAPKKNGEIVDYPDMQSAWETFSSIKKSTQQPNRAKELASRSMARSAETNTAQPKRMDWNAVDEMMDTLKT